MHSNDGGFAMIKGYIFDYGGTLDTAGCHWGQAIWHAYQRQKVAVSEADFRQAYVEAERTLGRNPIIQTDYNFHRTLDLKLRIEMEYLFSHHLWPVKKEEALAFHDAVLEDLYAQTQRITASSKVVLQEISQKYPMVLVSNFYGNIHVVLQEFHLDGLFQKVIESAVVGIRKPDARIYALGVQALGLQPAEVAVVGDSYPKDIVPAKKIGCKAIWLKGEGWTDEQFDETLPDKIISDLKEILLL
jgi:FMN phosphatase YigB (HAD superfamily)